MTTKKPAAAQPSAPTNVVALRRPGRAAKLRSEMKWGADVMAVGFCILPSLLFRAQHRLGLKSTHLAVVVQLADFWWHGDELPFPKKETIAERLGIKEKQVQRIMRDLEDRGYIQRVVRKTPHGQTSNSYDPAGLVKKLQELAPEFLAAKAARRNVERRGGFKTRTA